MKKTFKWVLVVCWMFIIFGFSAMPNDLSQKVSNKTLVTVQKVASETIKSPAGNIISGGLMDEEVIDEKYTPEGSLSPNYLIRKCAHGFEYFVLCILLLNAFDYENKKGLKYILFSIFICFLYACSDEIHQLFIDGRSCRFIDCMIDTTGAFIGSMLFMAYIRAKEVALISSLKH